MSSLPVRIGLAIAFVTAVTMAWLSYRLLSVQRRATAEVQHSLQVELETEELLEAVQDAETGQRSYLITDDLAYLAAYRTGRTRATEHLRRLSNLTRDNPEHQATLTQTSRDLDEKFAELSHTVDLEKHGEHALARQVVIANDGRRAMDRLRDDILHVQKTENALLAGREAFEERSARHTMLLGVGGSLLLAALVVIATVIVSRELRAREQLAEERAARAEYQGKLIGVIGHDVRNPLATVMTAAAMLEREPGVPPTEFKRKQLQRIHAGVRHIDQLLQMVLDFTRAQFGLALPVDAEATDLAPVVDGALEEMRLLHPTYRFERELAAPPNAWCDPRRIHQALINLLQNAVAHGEPEGTIAVRVRPAGEAVAIQVHNRGQPIAPEALPHIFEPFRRGAREPAAGHLGLGLFIVHEIVRAQRGSVQVSSCAAEGTTFELRLPTRCPEENGKGAGRGSGRNTS